jgi:hypothetical protein
MVDGIATACSGYSPCPFATGTQIVAAHKGETTGAIYPMGTSEYPSSFNKKVTIYSDIPPSERSHACQSYQHCISKKILCLLLVPVVYRSTYAANSFSGEHAINTTSSEREMHSWNNTGKSRCFRTH